MEYRDKKLEENGPYCELCGKKDSHLHLHHINESKYGNEDDEDTIFLCRACHQFIEHKWKVLNNPKNTTTRYSMKLKKLLSNFFE